MNTPERKNSDRKQRRHFTPPQTWPLSNVTSSMALPSLTCAMSIRFSPPNSTSGRSNSSRMARPPLSERGSPPARVYLNASHPDPRQDAGLCGL